MNMRTRTAAAVLAVLLLVSLASAQTCDEEVIVETYDGTIAILHLQTLYNCCCNVGSDVIREGFVIDVHEHEFLIAGGCDCLCCSDVEVEIAGLPPGDYTINIYKHTEHGGVELVGTWYATVVGECPPLVQTTFWSCGETGTEDELTWSVIKALYR
jgi:hypothetical protein